MRTPGAAITIIALTATLGCGEPSEQGIGGGQARDYRTHALTLEQEADFAAALEAYRDAARRYPTDAWPWSGVGRTARTLGRYREAVGAWEQAIRWDSTLVIEQIGLAELALHDGNPDVALRWIDGAVRQGGDTAYLHALRGRVLASAGRLTEARTEIDRALRLDSSDPRIRIASAFARLHADSTTRALAEIDGLVLEFPEDAEVRVARASLRRSIGLPDAAIEDLEEAVRLDANLSRARLDLARLLLERERVSEAESHFRRLLETNPRDARSLEGIGACALANGDPEAAEVAFRGAIESDPELASAHLALGRFLASQDRLEEAISMLRKARARATLSPVEWERCSEALADAYFQAGEPENALQIADALLVRIPDSAVARRIRGRALAAGAGGSDSGEELEKIATRPEATREEILSYLGWLLERGDAARALAVSEELLAAHPGDAEARVLRARARGLLGDVDGAEVELHELLAEEKAVAATRLALARLYLREDRVPDAIFHAEEGQRFAPDDPNFPVVVGTAHLANGDHERARAAFEREAALRPQSPKPWLSLGELEMQLGRPERAVPHFRKARDLDPEAWRASYLLGLAETGAGRPAEAVDAYRTALARNERVAEAHNNLAWLLADLDLDPILAEVHARRAAELEPENPHVLGTLGWAQYKNRLYDEAAVSLQSAVRLLPQDPMKHYMLGVVHFSRGMKREARAEIEAALELDPDFPRADSAGDLLRRLEG